MESRVVRHLLLGEPELFAAVLDGQAEGSLKAGEATFRQPRGMLVLMTSE